MILLAYLLSNQSFILFVWVFFCYREMGTDKKVIPLRISAIEGKLAIVIKTQHF